MQATVAAPERRLRHGRSNRLVCCSWCGNGIPLDGEDWWWHSPLGSLCARSLGRDDDEAISYSCAATMLGVSRGQVEQLVVHGLLGHHPDGGVLRASVVQRLADQTM